MNIGDMIKPRRTLELFNGKLYPYYSAEGTDFEICNAKTGETYSAAMIIGQERVKRPSRRRRGTPTMSVLVRVLIAGQKVLMSKNELNALFEAV